MVKDEKWLPLTFYQGYIFIFGAAHTTSPDLGKINGKVITSLTPVLLFSFDQHSKNYMETYIECQIPFLKMYLPD